MKMLTCKKHGFQEIVWLGRLLSMSHALENEKNSHYDALGVSRKATQAEIKAAYYKKSMVYHPDKNKGCEEAAKNFRAITTAYEILGNLTLRKKYDKGITITRHTDVETTVETQDNITRSFYRSRFAKDKPPYTGKTSIYNFDEWSRAHYGTTFDRKQKARSSFRAHEEREAEEDNAQPSYPVIGLITFVLICALLTQVIDFDRVKYKSKSKNLSSGNENS